MCVGTCKSTMAAFSRNGWRDVCVSKEVLRLVLNALSRIQTCSTAKRRVRDHPRETITSDYCRQLTPASTLLPYKCRITHWQQLYTTRCLLPLLVTFNRLYHFWFASPHILIACCTHILIINYDMIVDRLLYSIPYPKVVCMYVCVH